MSEREGGNKLARQREKEKGREDEKQMEGEREKKKVQNSTRRKLALWYKENGNFMSVL